MTTRTSSVLLLALLSQVALGGQSPPAAEGSALVIYKEGTKQYHRASCPEVRGTPKIVAMTRAQAESRGYKPHDACDPANPAAPERGDETAEPVTVVLDGTKYYHRSKACPRIKDAEAVKTAPLEIAGKKQWPCPECKPPIRRKSTENAVPGTSRGGR